MRDAGFQAEAHSNSFVTSHFQAVATATEQREADKTAARLDKEGQFNCKVAINADLRRLQSELQGLRR